MSTRAVGNTNGEGDGPASSVGRYIDVETPANDTISNTNVKTSFATTISLTNAAPSIKTGDVLRLTARGTIAIASAGTLLIALSNNSTLLTTAATLTSVSGTQGWSMEAILVSLAGDSECQGVVTVSSSASAAQIRNMINTSTTGVRVDVGALNIEVTWGVADPGNIITLRQMILERLSA